MSLPPWSALKFPFLCAAGRNILNWTNESRGLRLSFRSMTSISATSSILGCWPSQQMDRSLRSGKKLACCPSTRAQLLTPRVAFIVPELGPKLMKWHTRRWREKSLNIYTDCSLPGSELCSETAVETRDDGFFWSSLLGLELCEGLK